MKIAFRLLVLLGLFLMQSSATVAQTTLFSEQFEGFNSWQLSGSPSPNTWIVDNCAGNGITLPGTKAAYITSGGTIAGCGPTGFTHYGYANASSGTNQVVLYKSVNNSCFSALQVTFDLQINGVAAQDFAEVVYSIDNGVNWIPVSGMLTGVAAWQSVNYPLPALLNNTSFLLGFRFTYDAATIVDFPPAIDNVVLEGTTADVTPPTAVCPATFNIYANASCQATVPDLPPSVTKSDNCTATNDLIVTQLPTIGSMVSAGSTATITVFDQAGNQATCNTTLVFIDTIKPLVICPANQTVAADNGCNYTMTTMTGLASATDNCTASGLLTFSQSPIVGTSLGLGTHAVSIYAADASGNSGTCQFILTVADTTDPVVSCPTYHLITSNATCMATVGDLSAIPTVTDNCTSVAALFSFSQVPANLFTFTDTIQATIYVSDAAGNIGSCVVNLVAADVVDPIVTCLSDTTVFTTNPCNYFIPNLNAAYDATDVCTPSNLLAFSQSPLAATSASGVTTVTTTITDLFGNSSTCVTQVHPVDVIVPTITCPAAQNINNGIDCNFTVPDYTSLAVVTDNCSGFSLTQNPAAGVIVGSGTTTVTITVTDAGLNQTSCAFQLGVFENIQPSIVCPSDIQSCDTLVNFILPVGTDNCLYAVSQTDVTGLTSGSIFPVGITTLSYQVVDSSGNSASCSFNVEVLEIPDFAVILDDTIVLCNTFTSPINATAVSSGTGNWSVIQGAGTFANAGSSTTTVNGLAIGTNKLMWSVSSPSCGTKRDTSVIIVWPLPTTAVLQDTLLACSTDSLFVVGNVPQFGIGEWTSNSGINFEDVFAPVTLVSNVNGGTHQVIWTISSGTCPVSSDTMILVKPNVAQINFPDTTLCTTDFPLSLTGTAASFEQTSIWNTLSGEASFSNGYFSQTDVNGASIGSVEILYWLSHPICGITKDTLILFIQDCEGLVTDIPTLFTPNFDGKNDVFAIPNLALNYPGCRVEIHNRWGGLVFESDGYFLAWDGKYKDELVPMGTYFYHIQLNDEQNTVIDGSISIIR